MEKTALIINLIDDQKNSVDAFLSKHCTKVDFVRSIEHASRWKKYNSINIAVIKAERINKELIDKVSHFKQRDTQYCLILCDSYEALTIEFANQIPGMFVLTRDKKLGDELGLLSKLVKGKPTAPKRYPRYDTNNKALFAEHSENKYHEIKLTNLSKLGAKFFYENAKKELHKGDILKLKIQSSSDSKKEHCLHARIIWIQSPQENSKMEETKDLEPSEEKKSDTEFGVEFLKSSQLPKVL